MCRPKGVMAEASDSPEDKEESALSKMQEIIKDGAVAGPEGENGMGDRDSVQVKVEPLPEDTHLGDEDTCLADEDTRFGDEGTHFGDEDTCLGDKDTHLGYKDTCLGDEDTRLGDEHTYLGDEDTYLGDGDTYLGDKDTGLGDEGYQNVPKLMMLQQNNEKVCFERASVLYSQLDRDKTDSVQTLQNKMHFTSNWYESSVFNTKPLPPAIGQALNIKWEGESDDEKINDHKILPQAEMSSTSPGIPVLENELRAANMWHNSNIKEEKVDEDKNCRVTSAADVPKFQHGEDEDVEWQTGAGVRGVGTDSACGTSVYVKAEVGENAASGLFLECQEVDEQERVPHFETKIDGEDADDERRAEVTVSPAGNMRHNGSMEMDLVHVKEEKVDDGENIEALDTGVSPVQWTLTTRGSLVKETAGRKTGVQYTDGIQYSNTLGALAVTASGPDCLFHEPQRHAPSGKFRQRAEVDGSENVKQREAARFSTIPRGQLESEESGCSNKIPSRWAKTQKEGTDNSTCGCTYGISHSSEKTNQGYISGDCSHVISHSGEHVRLCTRDKANECTRCDKKVILNSAATTSPGTRAGKKSRQCTMCGKSFSQSQYLKRHMMIHNGEKPFQCTICDKRFRLRTNVERHMKIHSGAKPYQCTICDKRFSERNSVTLHMRTHTGEKSYQCTTCDTWFRFSSNLKKHMRTHSDERRYQCTSCHKRFRYDNNLKRHMETHTGEAVEKPYKCTTCTNQFRTSTHLRRHMRVHTDERLFRCTVCDRRFKFESNLKQHVEIHTGVKPYRCVICEKTFRLSGSLRRHARTHTGEKPYQCTLCNRWFAEKGTVKKHMRTHSCLIIYSP